MQKKKTDNFQGRTGGRALEKEISKASGIEENYPRFGWREEGGAVRCLEASARISSRLTLALVAVLLSGGRAGDRTDEDPP